MIGDLVASAVRILLDDREIKSVTRFSDEPKKLRVRVTREFKARKNDRAYTVRLSIGVPNYAERKFIKANPNARTKTSLFPEKK